MFGLQTLTHGLLNCVIKQTVPGSYASLAVPDKVPSWAGVPRVPVLRGLSRGNLSSYYPILLRLKSYRPSCLRPIVRRPIWLKETGRWSVDVISSYFHLKVPSTHRPLLRVLLNNALESQTYTQNWVLMYREIRLSTSEIIKGCQWTLKIWPFL